MRLPEPSARCVAPAFQHRLLTMNPTSSETRHETLEFAQRVLRSEAEAIERIELGDTFDAAVELVFSRTAPHSGSLVVSGLGKSGLIGQKLSATFASTGTPSHFLHPSEAMHGDLGRIRRDDVVLLLSRGGSTEEVVALASILKQDDVPAIAIVPHPASDLARMSRVALSIGDVTEACPHNLAPTASTAAMLALGDALALAVSRRRNFGVEDFRKVHPGGALGRQLMPVTQAMRFKAGDNLALIPRDRTLQQAYAEAEQFAQRSGIRRPGALLVVNEDGSLAGIVTDGDLRTALIRNAACWSGPVEAIMTTSPTSLPESALVRDAVRLVREHRFDELPVIDESQHPVGLIDVQDLVALKVIEG